MYVLGTNLDNVIVWYWIRQTLSVYEDKVLKLFGKIIFLIGNTISNETNAGKYWIIELFYRLGGKSFTPCNKDSSDSELHYLFIFVAIANMELKDIVKYH